MQKIIIEPNTAEDAQLILDLAKRLNATISNEMKTSHKIPDNPLQLLKNISLRGKLSIAIPNPVAWQKEIRKDRELHGREE